MRGSHVRGRPRISARRRLHADAWRWSAHGRLGPRASSFMRSDKRCSFSPAKAGAARCHLPRLYRHRGRVTSALRMHRVYIPRTTARTRMPQSGRHQTRRSTAQPRHRVRRWTGVLPALQRLFELAAILGATKNEHLAYIVVTAAEPCHVELARVAYPRGAVEGAVQPDAPPQPDVVLA